MLDLMRVNVLMPLMSRLGTMTASILVPFGVHAELAQQIGIGVTAAGLVIFDLTAAYLNRKHIAKSVAAKAVDGMANGLTVPVAYVAAVRKGMGR